MESAKANPPLRAHVRLVNDDPGDARVRCMEHRQQDGQQLGRDEDEAEPPRSRRSEREGALTRLVGATESPGDGCMQVLARQRAPDRGTQVGK